MQTLEYRNPVYTETGLIDCEINHPLFGWVPFTCSPDDAHAPFAADLFKAMSDGVVAPYVPRAVVESPASSDKK